MSIYVIGYVAFPVRQEKQNRGGLWSYFLMYFWTVMRTVMSLAQEEDYDRALLMAQCCKNYYSGFSK